MPQFHGFKQALDGEMKRLQAGGAGIEKKRAQPITNEEEEKLWNEGVSGSHSPQSLLDTMIMCGLYFALRSGQEHRNLQNQQLQLQEMEDGQLSLTYRENISKNNTGGIKHGKLEPKVVTHYENEENPSRCFIAMYKTYVYHCPPQSERKTNAFYLTPLKKPKGEIWFSTVPVGHNTLSNTVQRICLAAGVDGFKTNYSLRVTTATRLFRAGVDEQLIMQRTGHRSIDGIRVYKRTSEEQQKTVSAILHGDSTEGPSAQKQINLRLQMQLFQSL